MARKVLGARKLNHEQRVTLQRAINNVDQKLDIESKYCVPRLADKTQKQGIATFITDSSIFLELQL